MADYLFLYRGGDQQESEMSPEQMQAHMEKWHQWIGKAMNTGWMDNPGDALLPEGRVVDANKVVTDGPFAESKEHIAGFYIINAADLDDALAWANKVVAAINHPIEVRPFMATGRVAEQMDQMPGA